MEVNSYNEFYGEYGNQKWNRDEMSAVLKIEAEINLYGGGTSAVEAAYEMKSAMKLTKK